MPLRTCIGCRRVDEQSSLRRFVVVSGRLTPDVRLRLPGRGCWVHQDSSCFEQAIKRRAFGRALRTEVAIPDELS